MKSKMVVAALLSATTAWLGTATPSWAEPPAFDVILTAYTCEESPSNPMHPCGPLRWGGAVHDPGMACPVEWRNLVFDVPGYGTFRCDDTPRDGILWNLPHVDLRVPTVAEARRIGIQQVTIYRADSAAALTDADDAISQALGLTKNADPATAIARLLLLHRAREHFPALTSAVSGPDQSPVWAVTVWVPAEEIPADATAQPNAEAEIAARFFLFDAETGTLLTDAFVSKEVLEIMGWIQQDSVDFSK